MPNQPGRERTTFYIDKPLIEGLNTLRERDGVSASEAVRRAIAAFLEEKGIKVAPTTGSRPRKAKKR
jgi:hypothetical protein